MFYEVTAELAGNRLDKLLTLIRPEITRTFALKIIDDGLCFVNGGLAKASYKVRVNDEVSFELPDVKELSVDKEDIPLDIVYEDDDILIINKVQGMVVHPSAGHSEHTLVNAIMAHCDNLSSINGVIRPGIVHRIDKDTSGLICVAKNDKTHLFLSEQLKDHTMARTYMALVRGVINENSGTINLPIGRDNKNRQKMAVTRNNSKEAITNFVVKQRFKNHTLVECHLVTGRTHQIRVHFSYIGFPIEGDPLYGGKNYDILYKGGQLLTAVALKLIHPTTKKEMLFQVDLPSYFKDVINKLD